MSQRVLAPRRAATRRAILVHYHIFKNAGTSIDLILQSMFGDRWAPLEGATPTSLLWPAALQAFLKERPGVLAVSSHLLRPPAPAGIDVFPLVMVRHPLDRAVSVYNQLRRGASGGLESEMVARHGTFPQFLRWCLDYKSAGGIVIANYQVIHLSPASFRGSHIYEAVASEDDLRHAIGYLSARACFGTVDRFDATITRLCASLGEAGFGEVNFELMDVNVNENMTAGRSRSLEERVASAAEQLGPALLGRFVEENELDYRLYEWARLHQEGDLDSR